MKKVLFFFVSCCVAMGAMAQQWAGSTTTSDTIYRYGVTQIRPTTTGNPCAMYQNDKITIQNSFGTQYPEEHVTITPTYITLGNLIPAPTGYSRIRLGNFDFCNIDSDGHSQIHFKLNSNGKLVSDGGIQCSFIQTTSLSTTYISCSSSLTCNYTVSSNRLSINGATTSDSYKLAVNSGILCEELKVMADVPSSDYVFEPTYKLKPLSEVEAFVTENKHLPDVPSAKEFKENGYKVGEMDNLLLQKIEELTLYIINLQKQVEELKQGK
ncbi:MAG: hypothetical protein J6Y55_01355 [Bacteroidales bacterium]|nr:hypothetical protein [Bacteroidales bacterium]